MRGGVCEGAWWRVHVLWRVPIIFRSQVRSGRVCASRVSFTLKRSLSSDTVTLAMVSYKVHLKPLELNDRLVNKLRDIGEAVSGVEVKNERKAKDYLAKIDAPKGGVEEKYGATQAESAILQLTSKIVHGTKTTAEVVCRGTQTWSQLVPKVVGYIEKTFRDDQPNYTCTSTACGLQAVLSKT
ncbi:hypothetical protein MTO96_010724 [Rhipicephalus appendiculatus]